MTEAQELSELELEIRLAIPLLHAHEKGAKMDPREKNRERIRSRRQPESMVLYDSSASKTYPPAFCGLCLALAFFIELDLSAAGLIVLQGVGGRQICSPR